MKINNSFLTKISFLLLQVVCTMYSFGQNTTVQDSTSIISYGDKVIVKFNIDTETDSYSVNDQLTNSGLTVLPNSSLRFSLSLDYQFIGFSVGFSPKFLPGNNDDDLKGESSFREYGFRFFLGNLTQELKYSNTQGYYIENTQDFVPDWQENVSPYIQLPNLKLIEWGGSTSYIFNERFSFRNLVYQTEWQRKSAGSFIPKLDYRYKRFTNASAILRTVENNFDIKIAPSYYYTWVIHKNWFVSAFLSPAIGVRFSNNTNEENGLVFKMENQSLITSFDGGLQLGFSSEKFIFGANLNVDANSIDENSTTNLTDNKVYAKVYFGYRFDSPKLLQNFFNKGSKK